MSKLERPSPQEQLPIILKAYLDANLGGFARQGTQGELELEVRFGRGERLTRADYDSIVSKLRSVGFIPSPVAALLRIGTEYLDEKIGNVRQSNIRTEIAGIANISSYCKTDTLQNIYGLLGGTKFIKKSNYRGARGYIDPADFWNFGFRVAFQTEISFAATGETIRNLIRTWAEFKKTFRYITRHRLTHPTLPFVIDVSIVKDSKKLGRQYIPEYSFRDSGVLESSESYEIEIEVVNNKVGLGTPYSTPELLEKALRNMIKIVLSGIQRTNYPISRDERETIGKEYLELLWGKQEKQHKGNKPFKQRLYPRNFIGPSAYTLQIQNIAKINEDAIVPNIRRNYTVTDKADGERALLYIANNGKIYLIDTNMNILFTGAKTRVDEFYNTLLDGELILHNKDKQFINLYAAFDIYYLGGEDIRNLAFVSEEKTNPSRLSNLVHTVTELDAVSVVKGELSPLRIEAKSFYTESSSQSIFQGCAFIMQKNNQKLFEYETDGLIFTPTILAVGADKPDVKVKPLRTTWPYSLKWKPAEWNTIDFLLTVKKTATGQDFIGNIFQSGIDTGAATQLTQYKTLILRVGFDEQTHGYINPCQNIIEDQLPVFKSETEEGYRPMQFFPTNPPDPQGGLCNVLLRTGAGGEKQMFTESNELIENNMIVEFRYDLSKEGLWRWIPIRIRHDKTAEFRGGGRNYGNAFHVADSNWHTIHNPITVEMITTGHGIPEELSDDDIYYNRIGGKTSTTKALRDFHNLYVKKLLIMSVSKPGGTLIDLAAGQGGDIPKWISAKLKFVFGIDIARDNIENRLNGICARYLNYRKKFKIMPKGLFVVGNSSVNIRNADGIISDKGKQITRAVFGQGAKDVEELGKGVYAQYGVGTDGFDVCSMQFAIHYMFETQETLQNFLRNVSETTKVGGYFIGTAYDGETVFRMLKSYKQNESMTIMSDNKKMWEITKEYDRTSFSPTTSSVGYAINVYQESINKFFKEYLVNFEYLVRLLEDYGLVLLSNEEATEAGLPAPTGMFGELYGEMDTEIKRRPQSKELYGLASQMSDSEKRISYLNRYFVFKKIRSVDAEKVMMSLLHQTIEEALDNEDATKVAQEAARLALKPTKSTKPKPIKRSLRLVLDDK